MSDATWGERYARSLMNTYGAPALELVRGQGVWLWDSEGRRYLDLYSGIAVNLLGQCHPAVVRAVREQAGVLGHVSNYYASAPQIALAEKLLGIVEPQGAPTGSRVFFANSGTEANEAALKIVRAHANAQGGRPRILALVHGFHGRSAGSLSLTWRADLRTPFEPLIPGVEFVQATAQAVREAVRPDVAGVFVEPIQGEAGVVPVADDVLRAAREATRRVGAYLVVDEVQAGMGRTGQWMAHEHAGIVPDVVTLAKGLAGGLPMGACIGLGEAGGVLGPGMHGSTFGGNPVCAAAALAVLATIESEHLLEHAARLGAWWAGALRGLGSGAVREVRGRGLLLAVELAQPIAREAVRAGIERGFLLNATTPTSLRLAPALIIGQAQAESFTRALPGILDRARALAGKDG